MIAIISLGIISYHFIHTEIDQELYKRQLKYGQFLTTINQLIRFGSNLELIEKYLYELELVLISDEKQRQKFVFYVSPNPTGNIVAKLIREKENIYLLLQNNQEWRLYGDLQSNSFINYYILTFIGFFIVVLLFILVIRSILPLKTLRSKIRKFSNGESEIFFKLEQNDEIGELANEFDNAIQKINSLNQSRYLFLRAIMHELKTPITKGLITAEMVENPLHKQWLCSVFRRLDFLINEFAKVEELSSRNYCINKQHYSLEDILKQVYSMLLLEEKQIQELFTLPKGDFGVWADFEMLTLAIKNLIDNAIKYKTQGRVTLKVLQNDLQIINEGEPLTHNLKDYAQPFFKSHSHKSGGLGLGIYIIKNTLEAQGLKLEYQHKDYQNIFTIKGVIYTPKTT